MPPKTQQLPVPTQPGIFLTLEGGEGVGKSTAVKFIQHYLQQARVAAVVTREPGGTALAEQIRQLLLTPQDAEVLTPVTELLLMFASRAQHVANFIQPALAAGKWVICDRFVDASYAYQGGGRGLPQTQIAQLEQWVVGATIPQITILLDADPQLGLRRAKIRGVQDRIEQEKIDFFTRVRAAYLMRAEQDPSRFRVVDASQPLARVQAALQTILDETLGKFRAP